MKKCLLRVCKIPREKLLLAGGGDDTPMFFVKDTTKFPNFMHYSKAEFLGDQQTEIYRGMEPLFRVFLAAIAATANSCG